LQNLFSVFIYGEEKTNLNFWGVGWSMFFKAVSSTRAQICLDRILFNPSLNALVGDDQTITGNTQKRSERFYLPLKLFREIYGWT